eukprot:gene10800-22546_t
MNKSTSKDLLLIPAAKSDLLSTSDPYSYERWDNRLNRELPAFGQAGMDLLSGITDNYQNLRYETDRITVQIQDPLDPTKFESKSRKFSSNDYKDMMDYNTKREKYIAEKGKIWTYLSNSVDTTFFMELSKDKYRNFQADLNIHGLLKMIKNHAQKTTDSRGSKLKQDFNNFFQYNKETNILMPYFEFINKFESMCQQLQGKECEPTDRDKADRLLHAVHRPLFDSYITGIHALNKMPSFTKLKENLRNLEINKDINSYDNLKDIKTVNTNGENTKTLTVTVNNDTSKSKKKNKKRNRDDQSQNISNNNHNKSSNYKKFRKQYNTSKANNMLRQCGNCLKHHSGKCREPLVKCSHCHKMGHQSIVCNNKKNGYAPCAGCQNHNSNDTQTKVLVSTNSITDLDMDDLANEFVHARVANYNNSLLDTDHSDSDHEIDGEVDYGLVLSDNSTKLFNNPTTYSLKVNDDIDDDYVYFDTGASKHIFKSIRNLPFSSNLQVTDISHRNHTIVGVDGNPNNNMVITLTGVHPLLGPFNIVPNSAFNLVNYTGLIGNFQPHLPLHAGQPIVFTHRLPIGWTLDAINLPKGAIISKVSPHAGLYRISVTKFRSQFSIDHNTASNIKWPSSPIYPHSTYGIMKCIDVANAYIHTCIKSDDTINNIDRQSDLEFNNNSNQELSKPMSSSSAIDNNLSQASLRTPNKVEVSTYSTDQIKRANKVRYLHCVLGHPSKGVLVNALSNGVITGTRFTSNDINITELILGPCPHCIRGKVTQQSFRPSDSTPSDRPGSTIHCDIMALPELSIGGNRFVLFTVDDFSGYISLVGLVDKEVKTLCKGIDSLIATYSQHKIIINNILTDHESNLSACLTYLNLKGIKLHQTPPYQHAQKCERYVRTIKDRIRTIISSLSYHLPLALYLELASSACYYINSLPNTLHPRTSPRAIIEGTKLDISMIPLVPFGQPALFEEPKRHQVGYAPRADYGICLGPHPTTENSVRAYIFETGRVVVRRNYTPLLNLPSNVIWKQHPSDPRLRIEFINRSHNRPTMEVFSDLTDSTNTTPSKVIPHSTNRSDVNVSSNKSNTHITNDGINVDRGTTSTRDKHNRVDTSTVSASKSMSSNPSAPTLHDIEWRGTNLPSSSLTNVIPNSNSYHTIADKDLQGGYSSNHMLEKSVDTTVINDKSEQASTQPTLVDATSADITTNSSQLIESIDVLPTPIVSNDDDHEPIEVEVKTHHYNTRRKHKTAFIQIALRVSIASAIAGPYSTQTVEAITAEINTLLSNKVGHYIKITDIPHYLRRNILPSFTFIKYKQHTDGSFDRVKARHVAGGHLQTESMYTDISSTTVNITSVVLLLNIYTLVSGYLVTFDIKGAFLNASWNSKDPITYIRIDKHLAKVWIQIDPTAAAFLTDKGELILELDKYIYGLKQSPLMWQAHLEATLKRLGYIKLVNDDCLYIYRKGKHFSLIAIHVDDILQLATSKELVDHLHNGLIETYHGVTYESKAKSYIGINITLSPDRKVVELDMVASIQQLVDKHLDKDYRSYSSPAGNDLFELTADSKPLPKGNKFLSIVMSLMYIARLVRPDILLSVVYLSTRSQEPTEQDYKKLLRILSYLKATINIKLRLSCDNLHIHCHCDASYGSHHDGGSHTGYWISL